MTRRPARAVWPVVGVLSAASVLVSLQGTLLLPLVPVIPEIYDVTPVAASWMVTSTLLAGAIATPIASRLADMYGKRRLIVLTLATMMAGSVLIAVADGYAWAVAGRALQGSATALVPVAMSVMKDVLPRDRVAFGVAMVSASLGIGAAVGLPLAGIIYAELGWTAMFLMTAALCPFLMLGASRLLPPATPGERERFDWLGAGLLVGVLVPLLVSVSQGNVWGWTSSRALLLCTVAALSAVAWAAWEMRVVDPLISLRLALIRPVLLTNVATTIIAVGMLANLLIASQQLGTPSFVDGGLGLSPGLTGLVMGAPPALLVVGAPITARLLATYGARNVLLAGALVMGLSYVARVFLDDSVIAVAVGATLVGAGTGLAIAAIPLIIMASVPGRQTASANGVNALCRMIGLAISTAGLAALASATSIVVDGREYPTRGTIHASLWICAAASLSALIVIWFIPRMSSGGVIGTTDVPQEHEGRPRVLVTDPTGMSAGFGDQTLADAEAHGYAQRSNSLFHTRAAHTRTGANHSSAGHIQGRGTEMSAHENLVVDASVEIYFANGPDLRGYLDEPFASRGFPDPDIAWFAPPDGQRFAPGSQVEGAGHPSSDPEVVGASLFGDRGYDFAVVHPMSNGIQPDRFLNTAILSAYNQMMVDRWLDSGTYASQFRGTIRVTPDDIDGALREIERWKDHPQVVQIGIPLQSQAPYGRPQYRPLWEAAVDANLPVAVHLESGNGIMHPPTPSGVPRTFAHHLSFQPLSFIYHLFNMIVEGVFEANPDLKIVWADGAADMLTPFSWRLDTFGRPHLEQTPWAPRMPSDYLENHVYFIQGALDGPGDVEFASEWLTMTGKEDMLMFGSSYPSWQINDPSKLPSTWTSEQLQKVLGRTAASLYRLPTAATATV
ncbi:MFS transporter [Aeromicrobium sp. SMF47]|uniref:MFS transporter n=1 Tax=Aeromicrobium yanjiei TaxID=2662028 RepID=A0A5Q2MEL5_9ACTN|nr:MFS transporter [Aeromicrobium yanjiei]MRJ75472.1 MFS transporter [Aeromicrobium yanjiei]QGG40101.1 MFS transporter [Aeromicrobium yanjiei]